MKIQELDEYIGYHKKIYQQWDSKAICIKLKLPELNKRNLQLTKRQYVNTAVATSTSAVTINATNNITGTAVTTVPKGGL